MAANRAAALLLDPAEALAPPPIPLLAEDGLLESSGISIVPKYPTTERYSNWPLQFAVTPLFCNSKWGNQCNRLNQINNESNRIIKRWVRLFNQLIYRNDEQKYYNWVELQTVVFDKIYWDVICNKYIIKIQPPFSSSFSSSKLFLFL